jgi:hypothetical protein
MCLVDSCTTNFILREKKIFSDPDSEVTKYFDHRWT